MTKCKFVFLAFIILFLFESCKEGIQNKNKVCFEGVSVNIGDSFSRIDEIYKLNPDPNNHEGIESGCSNFYSTLNHGFRFKNGNLNSIELFKFDKEMKLIGFQISYTINVDRRYLNETYEFLEGKVENCLTSEDTIRIFSESEIDVISGLYPKYNYIFKLKSEL